MIKRNNKAMKTFLIPEVKAEGWLKRQLQVQMDGLTGCLHEVWDSVGSYSGWLGGTGENWERAPYYLDGLLPIAWYLKDEKRWNLAMRFIEWTLNSQDEEGNFGPEASKHDYWSRYVMLKVLIQYYEIKEDERVIEFFENYFKYLYKKLQLVPAKQWSRARVGDLLYCIEWYLEKKPNENVYYLVDILREQALDWVDIFEEFPFVRPVGYYYNWEKELDRNSKDNLDEMINYHTHHIVNVTMGFKYPAMLSYFYSDKDYEAISIKGMKSAEKYHGVATGAVNGDEHLSGNDPSQGAELCSIVEYMFSLQTMLERFGNPYFGDKLEQLAYNTLPATITEDFMAHQYLQQANQVLVSKAPRQWFNNNEEANMFGLEPNFGCCTANMHQGWPKFVKSLWYLEGDRTVVSMVFAPSSLNTRVEGNDVYIQMRTEYPFKNKIEYKIEKAENLSMKIRVPGWCKEFELKKNGEWIAGQNSGFYVDGFVMVEGLTGGDNLEFTLQMEIRRSKWFRDSMAIERGPLVYALDMKENWHVVKEVAGVKDYEVYPESPWNYAIGANCEIEVEEQEVGAIPFSKKTPPVILTTKGRRLEDWGIERNSAGPVPASPVVTSSGEEKIQLIPYGCTKLRVTQFPYYN
ncbi:beta-L-arabinofuranosidase domain-containing protein [Roseburia hominis]